MAKLHELLAVESDLEQTFRKMTEETIKTFTKKPEHFLESLRKLELFDENAPKPPEDYKAMTETVGGKLNYYASHIVRYLDVVFQKEATNQTAKADLTVDGKVIEKDVPATFLLGLENKLRIMRQVVHSIPTLAPGKKWEKAPEKGNGVWVNMKPDETYRNVEKYVPQVLYEATKNHPAQVEKIKVTEPIGKYTKYEWSSMLSPAEKSELLARIDKLIRATKQARMRANTAPVQKRKIGEKIFEYLGI